MGLAGLSCLRRANVNLTTVADLNHQHTHLAVLNVADHSDVAHTIAPVVTQFWSDQVLTERPRVIDWGDALVHVVDNTKCYRLI